MPSSLALAAASLTLRGLKEVPAARKRRRPLPDSRQKNNMAMGGDGGVLCTVKPRFISFAPPVQVGEGLSPIIPSASR